MNANKLAEKSKNLLEKYTLEGYASKRVSFIVATRNRAEYLMQALERSRTLVTPEDELIIIDGGSTDNTAEVVRKYSDIVDIFISEPDKGPGHAFSKGMLLARGKYLKHLPDDDVVYPAAMEQAIRVMEEHPEIDLLVCGGTREFGGKVKPVWLPPGTNYGYSPRDIFKYGASGIGFVIRRSALPLVGLFPVSLADDVDFAINVIKRGGTVKFCRINLFHHPIYEHSAVIRNLKAHRRHKYSLVRQYSLSYYYWYRLERFLKRRALYNLAVLAFKPSYVASFLRREGVMAALRRVLMLLTGKKHPESTAGVEEPVWDGGFS